MKLDVKIKNLKCYVCGKTIRPGKEIYIGFSLYRHKNCRPGSSKWFRSGISKNSSIRKYFEEGRSHDSVS